MTADAGPLAAPRPALRWALGALAVAFGLATLLEGGSVLFGGPSARAAAGNVVPFVLVFNFVAGFGYVLAGVATLRQRRWALWIARGLALSTLAVFVALAVHALLGGAGPFPRLGSARRPCERVSLTMPWHSGRDGWSLAAP